jgi:hypothetical protein
MYKENSDPDKGTFEQEYAEHNRWTLQEFEDICLKASFKTLKIKSTGKHWLIYEGMK